IKRDPIIVEAIGLVLFTLLGLSAYYAGTFSPFQTSFRVWFPNYVAIGLAVVLPFSYVIVFFWSERRTISASPSPSGTWNDFRQEYETLNKSVATRENSLLVSGSIFVTASTVLLSQAALVIPPSGRTPIIFGSWAL